MRLSSLVFTTLAALSMVAAPAFAAPANPAAKLSLANGANNNDVRAGAPHKKASKYVAPSAIFIGLAVTAGVVGIAVAASHSDSRPASA